MQESGYDFDTVSTEHISLGPGTSSCVGDMSYAVGLLYRYKDAPQTAGFS